MQKFLKAVMSISALGLALSGIALADAGTDAAYKQCERLSSRADWSAYCVKQVQGKRFMLEAVNVCGRQTTFDGIAYCVAEIAGKSYDVRGLAVCGAITTNEGTVACLKDLRSFPLPTPNPCPTCGSSRAGAR